MLFFPLDLAFMLRARLRAWQSRYAPAGSRRHRVLRSIWHRIKRHGARRTPRLSLLLVVGGSGPRAIERSTASVFQQSDPRWQLILLGAGAQDAARALPEDPRIVAIEASGDAAALLNAGAARAAAPFVAVVNAGDEVLPRAVEAIARASRRRNVDVLYGDETDLAKPDWSVDLLLAFPYTGRLCAFRRGVPAQLGGWRADMLAAEDYRLLLAAARAGTRVRRVPAAVYRRREAAATVLTSPAAISARRAALEEHFAAAGEHARVVETPGPARIRVEWPIAGQPLVSIVIATRDRLNLLRQCVESIEHRSTYPAYEIVIVDNGSAEPETLEYFRQSPHRVVPSPGPFNFSGVNNEGARAARGEYVIFLNNDTEVIAHAWIEEMLQHAQRPQVGCVGAKLLFPDGRVQHAGVVLHDGSAHHLGYACAITPANWHEFELVRDFAAVTAACMMVNRQRFLDAGAFDESFPVNYNDVELCVRLLRLGYRHVYTPYAALYHHESASRPPGVAAEEGRHLRDALGGILWNDPFCPRTEVRGTPRWALDRPAGRAAARIGRVSRRTWSGVRSSLWRPTPLLALRPTSSEPEGDAIRWIDRVEIRGEIRSGLFMHPNARRTYRLSGFGRSRFEAYIALLPDVWDSNHGGVRFRLLVSRDGRTLTSRQWRVDPRRVPAHRAWMRVRVPLRTSGGGSVDVALATEVPEDAAPAHAWAVWGDPVIAERRPLRTVVARQLDIVRRLGWRAAVQRYARVLRGGGAQASVLYDAWFQQRALTAKRTRDAAGVERLAYRPRISVVTPVYNTPPDLLRRAVQSVRDQWYTNWQLCLADDASTRADTRAALDTLEGADPRIRIVRQPVNGGIAAASNAALDLADGEFVALLDHDDELAPDALLAVVEDLNEDSSADVVYTDEDKLDFDGTHVEPFFKPDWSPEYLRSTMYLGHLVVYRRSILEKAGRFRSAFDGSQDYDLALRVSEHTQRFVHVPHVLYHWRKIQGSAAATTEAKPWGLQAARRALVDHVSRLPLRATVEDQPGDGFWRVRYEIAGNPLVSVILPSNGRIADTPAGPRDLALECLRSIVERTDYDRYEILLVDNGRISPELAEYVNAHPCIRRVVYEFSGAFNFARKINFSAAHAKGDHLLLLNDDTEVIDGEWLRAMLEFSQQRDIGAVGARLLFPDGRLQHVGVVMGIGGGACHVFSGLPGDSPGYYGSAWVIRNYSAVTGACCMTRREVFEALNGFDERFATDFNDVDYCLRVRDAGYRVVFTPFAALYHFEGGTFGSREHIVNPDEIRALSERWGGVIANDPYYNPNLTRSALDYSLRL